MQDILEDLQQLNKEFRDLCVPFDQRMTTLDERITQHEILFDRRIEEIESTMLSKVSELLDRVQQIESKLNISPETERPMVRRGRVKTARTPRRRKLHPFSSE